VNSVIGGEAGLGALPEGGLIGRRPDGCVGTGRWAWSTAWLRRYRSQAALPGSAWLWRHLLPSAAGSWRHAFSSWGTGARTEAPRTLAVKELGRQSRIGCTVCRDAG